MYPTSIHPTPYQRILLNGKQEAYVPESDFQKLAEDIFDRKRRNIRETIKAMRTTPRFFSGLSDAEATRNAVINEILRIDCLKENE